MKFKNQFPAVLLVVATALSAPQMKAEDIVKTGFNMGALPAVSFSSDLGFQYGVILNFFDYGNGSHYPAYDHSLYLEASKYTKGTSVLRMYYDSDRLIEGVSTFIDAGYMANDMMDFYGFNGYQSVYDAEIAKGTGLTANRGFYKMKQDKLYLQADLRGDLEVENLFWTAGAGYYHYTVDDLNFDKLNKGKDAADKLPEVPSLYDLYQTWGLIDDEEADGGNLGLLKAGVMFDTRNAKNNPSSGIYSEALLEWAVPGISESSYLAYSIMHRQYIGLAPSLNFAYRVGVQGIIGDNKIPFYRRPQLISSFMKRSVTTGLGGNYTLRGILQNRVVGDAFALANLELRWKVLKFTAFNQNFYIGLNPFLDAGYILDPCDMDLTLMDPLTKNAFFSEDPDGLHLSAGCGLKIAMNENFIISCDLGKALNEQDNSGLGVYICLNYLF